MLLMKPSPCGGFRTSIQSPSATYPNYRVTQKLNNKTQKNSKLSPKFPYYIIIPIHTTLLSIFPTYHHLKHKPVLPMNTQDSCLYLSNPLPSAIH